MNKTEKIGFWFFYTMTGLNILSIGANLGFLASVNILAIGANIVALFVVIPPLIIIASNNKW